MSVRMLVALLCLPLAACTELDRVRIASQNATEPRLLAEILALVAESEGVPVERLIPYGDSATCLEAIQAGVIDVYPEYGGTILGLSGVPPTQDADTVADEVRALLAPRSLRWTGRFGLRNGFTVVVRNDVALRHDLARISDLGRWPRPLRLAVDEAFGGRMSDGLPGLARRYGLSVEELLPFPSDEHMAEVESLLDGRANAAVLFETDPAIGNFGLVSLEDDLGFFPVYEVAALARADVLEAEPRLEAALERLRGKISAEQMRRLIALVEEGGEDHRAVARRFLRAAGILPGAAPPVESERTVVTLAIGPESSESLLAVRAAGVLREVMPARPLKVILEDRPAEAVRAGRARYGLVGAEEFLVPDADGHFRIGESLEAVGAVGARVAHLVVPPDTGLLLDLPELQLGVGPRDGSSHRVASLLMELLDLHGRVTLVPSPEPLALLDAGTVDVVLVMLEPGHARMNTILAREDRELRSITALTEPRSTLRYPFLRPARIAAGTYPGETAPVDTLASQVVLATLVPSREDPLGDAGVGVIPGLGRDLPLRVPPRTAAQIQQAFGPLEPVDPLLPVSPGLVPDTPVGRAEVVSEPFSALLNVLAVAFLVGMVVLFFRPLPEARDIESG